MSRIGKKPVPIPSGVTANVEGQTVTVKGPKGELQLVLHDDIDGRRWTRAAITVDPRDETKRARAHVGHCRARWSPTWSTGVTKGFEEKLEINGVGYRAAMQGKNLQLQLGYSHDVDLPDPGGHHDRDAEADRDRDHRHRQAAGRPGRRRDPRLPPARALQGQGRAVRRRKHPPQGRQEEVRSAMATVKPDRPAHGARAPRRQGAADGRAAAVGVPLVQEHLRPGDRRRRRA